MPSSRYPTELSKGIERSRQTLGIDSKRGCIRTYDEQYKPPYMKSNLQLVDHEFKRVEVPREVRRMHSSKSVESLQPLNHAG